jgi:processive 1,2-diacylglycerol beta-glucosyltransferase
MTTAEALAAGLPMVLTHPIPGPEERHIRYLEERGVAVRVSKLEEIPQLTFRLLNDAPKLEEMRWRALELARPAAAHAIAQVARALLERATYIDLLATTAPHPGESAYLM